MPAKVERLSLLTIIGVLLAMLIGLVHALAESQLAHLTPARHLFPAGWFDA